MVRKKIMLMFLFATCLALITCKLLPKEPDPNNVPSVSSVILTPSNPVLTDHVELNYSYSDADGDEDQSEIQWFRNDVMINNEGNILSSDGAIDGDKIYAEVTAYDSIDYGNTLKSNTVFYERETFTPIISHLADISGIEDEIAVGSVAKDMQGKISDQDHTLDELTIELTQTNPDLIKLKFSDDYNQLIIESYQADGNGESEITVTVTDPDGLVVQKSFKYLISPMTDISGTILDSDTWEANTTLQGWIVINGDTTWTDAQCRYDLQIDPTSSIYIEAGYRSLNRLNPMSFITTAREIAANNDINNIDIMVYTYLNNNLTPEEQRIMAWETNFWNDGHYEGARAPSTTMTDKIILSGNPAISWDGSTYLEEMTTEEIADIKRIRADSINVHLKHPFPLEETTYYDGILDEYNVVTWERRRWDNPFAINEDYNKDGIMDYIHIATRGAPVKEDPLYELYYNHFISNLLEEGYASRGEFFGISNPRLEGKTIAYEFIGTEWVHKCDVKFIKFIEGVAREKGYLKPKMPLDDVFRIQD